MYHKILRGVFGVALVLGLLFGQETRVLAGSTGQITGKVTDATSNAPIAGASVTAISPTGTYKAVTTANGYYAIVDVFPDSYRVTASAAGYTAGGVDGVTVYQNNSSQANVALAREASVLGRVTVRGVMTVVQPNVTADQYVLTSKAADATNGSGGSMSLYQTPGIIGTLPGVTLDSGGYSHIRGSRLEEVGFEYDGLMTVEPVTGTFATNNVEDGISRLQVSTGGYDASGGNAISGVVNTVVGVGTYPPRGTVTTLMQSPTFYHGLNFDYGSATPDGRFSWYTAAVMWNSDYDWGQRGTFYPGPMNFESSTGVSYLSSVQPSRDGVLNVHYKFGANLANDLQFLATTGIEHYNNGILPLYFPNANPVDVSFDGNAGPLTYLDPATGLCADSPNNSTGNYEVGLFPGQTSCSQLSGGPSPEHDDQGYFIDKLQLTHNFGSNASLAVHYARVGTYVTFWNPFGGGAFDDIWENRHSDQQEAFAEYTIQANPQNLVKVGGQDVYSKNLEVVALPSSDIGEVFPANNRDKAYWISDQLKPNDKLTLNVSGRRDSRTILPQGGSDFQGTVADGSTWTASANQLRGSLAYELGAHTVIRASAGNFVELPYTSRAERFLTFAPGYADTSPANTLAIREAHPDVPESHQADASLEQELGGGYEVKVTPFWRKTDNLILTFKAPGQVSGTPQAAGPYLVNGIEAELQFPHVNGVSGYLNFTHTRALAEVTGDYNQTLPAGAATFKALFPASFVPTNVANLVLTVDKGRWEFNPELNYQNGYPYGVGRLTYNDLNCVNTQAGAHGDPSQPCAAIIHNPLAYSNTDGNGNCGPGFCTQLIDPSESTFADGRICCTALTVNFNVYYHLNAVTTVGVQMQNLNQDYRPISLVPNYTLTYPVAGNNGFFNYGTAPYIPSSIYGSREFVFTLVQKI